MRLSLIELLLLIVILTAAFPVVAQTEVSANLSEFEDLADALISSKSADQRARLLETRKKLVTPDLPKALIRQGNTHLMAGQYSTAFDIYGLAENIAERIGDKAGMASASLDIGTVYYFQANYPAAIEHYQKARDLFVAVSDDLESAKALSGLALIYKEQRRDAEALQTLQQVLKEFTAVGDKEEIANTLNSIGSIYYGQGNFAAAAEAFIKSNEANSNADNQVRVADSLYMQGDYSEAFNYYQRALDSNSSRQNVGVTVAALNGAANSLYFQGNYEEALQFYQKDAAIQSAQSNQQGLINSLRGVGNVYRSLGNYGAALENYFKCLKLSEQQKLSTGPILGSIGLVRALQGDYDRALDYYGKALAEFEATANSIETARVLSLSGNVNYAQGRYESALNAYHRALDLREHMNDKSGQAEVLAGIGSALLKQGKYSEALDSYQKALEFFNTENNKERMADVLTRVAEAFLFSKDYSKALSAAESAASLSGEVDSPEIRWYARTLAAKAHRGLDHQLEANQAFTDAIAGVESLRTLPSTLGGVEHNTSTPYLSAMDLLISQHRIGEAFDYAERAKVQSLFEMLRVSQARPNRDMTAAEQKEESRLAGEASSLALQLDRESQSRTTNDTRRANLRDRLRQTRVQYADLRQRLFVSHPHLKSDRGELAPLKLNELRSLITDAHTALIEYSITEENTYLFVLTASEGSNAAARKKAPLTLKAYPLEIKNGELVSRVRELERQIASRSPEFDQAARDLYDLLIRPAGDQLVLTTRLVIVPDGVLWQLPFEALLSAEDHFLVDQMQISYAPSLTALRDMRNRRTLPMKPLSSLLATGSPHLSTDFINRNEVAYPNLKLTASTDRSDESRQVATSFGIARSRVIDGAELTKERLRSEATRVQLLHLSGPMLLDNVSPMSSFLGVSVTNESSGDGFLSAREVMNWQTSAQLVVISNARYSGNYTGLSAAAMTWSWFVSGTPATMLSRWEVDSPAATQMLSQFYSNIKPTTRVAASQVKALRQSVLTLRHSKEYQHPYYWAAFQLLGDAR